MARVSNIFSDYLPNALALAIEVYNDLGFIRSGEGFKSIDTDSGKVLKETKDNKTIVIDKINAGHVSRDELAEAGAIIDKSQMVIC